MLSHGFWLICSTKDNAHVRSSTTYQLEKVIGKSITNIYTLLNFPGLPPFPPSNVVAPLLDRESNDYKIFIEYSHDVLNLDGISVNTFESLEVKSWAPQVTVLGPMVALKMEMAHIRAAYHGTPGTVLRAQTQDPSRKPRKRAQQAETDPLRNTRPL
ncbi:UDP-sugar:glycosyltransferase [Striga asiatica]|uniref:UDP-sugar:glycosyltransferase n=1 Tax=Striga asiatica TaxID=4170 RepID=A0A5A7QL64_STRAF|nr:UDP-sugar:glycosyltransferase [Striga asiatica]